MEAFVVSEIHQSFISSLTSTTINLSRKMGKTYIVQEEEEKKGEKLTSSYTSNLSSSSSHFFTL